jgi:hypothetical protein
MTIVCWRDCFSGRELAGELHPLFYYLEGLVLRSVECRDRSAGSTAAYVYTRLVGERWAELGAAGTPTYAEPPARSDVLAQALRVGCLLKGLGHLSGRRWDERLEALARRLAAYVGRDGTVYFFRESTPGPRFRNTWSAMFAYQALLFHEHLCEWGTIGTESVRLLI